MDYFLDLARGFRKVKKAKELMHAKDDIVHVHHNDPARLAVLGIPTPSSQHTGIG